MRDIFNGDLIELTTGSFKEFRPFDKMRYLDNHWFGYVDSAVYYSLIKIYKPDIIIEVGSGYSTAIAHQATENTLICIDPNPRADIDTLANEHIADKVENLAVEIFDDCNMLFIDSSHYWEAGDLPFIFEKVLPWLKTGTLIHFHDIFLPDDYPPAWYPRMYNEQYYLKDFLEANPTYETVWPAYYMATQRTKEVVDVFGVASSMGSFWVRKC
jgi:hypothetical protein